MSKKVEEVAVEQRWLSARQACRYTNLSRDRLDKLVCEGRISKHKLGEHRNSRIVFSKSVLDTYIASC